MPSADWRNKVTMIRFPYIMERLMQKAAEVAGDREAENPLRLSNSGACVRKLAMQRINWDATQAGKPAIYPQEALQPRALLVFHLGDMVENSLRAWIVNCGDILYGQPQARVTLRIVVDGHTHEIHGHLDGMIQEPGQEMSLCILEIKSISSKGFDHLSESGPDYGYACQVTSYMRCLGLQRARVLYENKNTSHLDEWLVEYSPALMEEIEARFATAIRATPESLPPREYDAEDEREWVRGTKGLIGMTAGTGTENLDSTGKAILEIKKSGYWRATGRQILPWNCGYCSLKRPCWGESIEEVVIEAKPTWYVKKATS